MTIVQSVLPWWQARSGRERFLLQALAVLVALLCAWYGVATPLRRASASAESHLARAARQLAEIEIAAVEISAIAGRGETRSDDGFAALIANSAEGVGFPLGAQQMESSREIAISADNVASQTLFEWIRALQQGHGVVVTNLTITRGKDGMLHVEARFARGGV